MSLGTPENSAIQKYLLLLLLLYKIHCFVLCVVLFVFVLICFLSVCVEGGPQILLTDDVVCHKLICHKLILCMKMFNFRCSLVYH